MVLFTYSNNTWEYLKRIGKDQDLAVFCRRFAERRAQQPSAFALGCIDWNNRYYISCLHKLIQGAGTSMFTHDVEYIIHPRQGPCPLVEPKEPVTLPVEDQLGNVLTLLTEELDSFPWGKRGKRLLTLLRVKGVVKDDDTLEGVPWVDILKTLCTPEPPGAKRKHSPQQEKILRLLKRLKKNGLQIPACYIQNRAAALVFWRQSSSS